MSFTNLNTSITVYRKTNTGDNVTPNYTYPLVDTINAVVNQLSESRFIRNEGDKIVADHEIFIDYISTLEFEDYIKDGDDYFQIYSIKDPNKRNHHLEIKALQMPRGFSIS